MDFGKNITKSGVKILNYIRLITEVKPLERINLSAIGSIDPVGEALSYEWFCYSEAGTYKEKIIILDAANKKASFTVPANAGNG